MKSLYYFTGAALALVLIICVAGCTSASPATQPVTPAATSSAAGSSSAPLAAATTAATGASPAAASSFPGIDTKVSVHYNDYSCLDIQKGLGVTYLFPDEKYTISVAPPVSGAISPNLLVLDVTDYGKLGTAKPSWDTVQKTWAYEGIVPLVKLIDINSPQTATLKIKNQGAYYVCIDDRKETGTGDAVYQVPVQVTKN